MKQIFKVFCGLSLVCGAVLSGSGCRGYMSGSLMHPQVKTVSVGTVINQADNAVLGVLLRQKVVEELMRDASIGVLPQDKAQTVLRMRLLPCNFRAVASAKKRDTTSSNRDRNAYQSEVFRAEVTVEVRLDVPGRERPAVDWKTVTGSAEFSRLSDVPESRQDAVEAALSEAARKAVVAVVEAW